MIRGTDDPALGRGVSYLAGLQGPGGAITAFDDTIFDVWETLNAARTILDLGGPRGTVDRALRFVATTEREGGWVLHTSDFDEGGCLETTAEYTSLLLAAEVTSDRVRHLLASIRDGQTPFGCWAILSRSIKAQLQTFPSATAFALNALRDGGEEPADLDGGQLFLRTSQNADGHWGDPWQYYGHPCYAMAPILEALAGDPASDEVRDRARGFLHGTQRDDGSWRGAPLSPALVTALAVRAGLNAGMGARDEPIRRAVAHLRDAQRTDGGWDGGTFPLPSSMGRVQREDVYATTQALRALHTVARLADQ